MHVGIANPRWQGKRSLRMPNHNFTYLVRGPWAPFANRLTESRAQINNKVDTKYWDIIIQPRSDFNGDLVNAPLKLWHRSISICLMEIFREKYIPSVQFDESEWFFHISRRTSDISIKFKLKLSSRTRMPGLKPKHKLRMHSLHPHRQEMKLQ